MGDIIPLNGDDVFSNRRDDDVRMAFLVDEGLELLSLYREVQSDAIRWSILSLLRSVVAAEDVGKR